MSRSVDALIAAMDGWLPERPDSQGRRRPLIRPLGDPARREIERQIPKARRGQRPDEIEYVEVTRG